MFLVILFKQKKKKGHEPEKILALEPFCFPYLPFMKIMQLRYSVECIYFQRLEELWME